MLIIRGINVFPSQVEDVIGEMDFLTPFYHITVDSVNYMDNMLVEVEIADNALTDDMVKLNKMTKEFDRRLKDVLNIKAEIKLALPGSMPRSEGKAKHVTDLRSYE
jgi:phenylacetate-CoA ligase